MRIYEVVKQLQWIKEGTVLDPDARDAIEIAIRVLQHNEVEKDTNALNNDCISRQGAIDAIDNLHDKPNAWLDCAVEALEKLPSAQPEIIRCTECKHYREYDSEYVKNAVVVQCMADRYPISETIPDGWFCAGAERRTDDGE